MDPGPAMSDAVSGRSGLRAAALFLLAVSAVAAQTGASRADSGWTPLFNGRDFSGLYVRLGGTLVDPAVQTSFRIGNGALHVPATGGVGAIATKAVYSRYQVRVEYRFGKGQANPNAGLLYHIDPADWSASDAFGSKTSGVPYLGGAYVKSVEYQMYRGDAGAFLGIMNVWVTADTKGDANHTWKPGGFRIPPTRAPAWPIGGSTAA
jgi:hypothetical protein